MHSLPCRLAALLSFALVLGCPPEETPPDNNPPVARPDRVAVTVTPAEGAELASEEVSITIPPGALSGDVEITIDVKSVEELAAELPNEGAGVVTDIYDFGPDGQTFTEPVAIELDLGTTSPEGLVVAVLTDDGWQQLDGQYVDGNKIGGKTTHFSKYAAVNARQADTVDECGDDNGGCYNSRCADRLGRPPLCQKVLTGVHHTCELRPSGQIRCWGILAQMFYAAAFPSPAGTDFVDVAVGDVEIGLGASGYACGLRSDGSVVCWGVYEGEPLLPEGGLSAIKFAEEQLCGVTVEGGGYCVRLSRWQGGETMTIPPEQGPLVAAAAVQTGTMAAVRSDGTAFFHGGEHVSAWNAALNEDPAQGEFRQLFTSRGFTLDNSGMFLAADGTLASVYETWFLEVLRRDYSAYHALDVNYQSYFGDQYCGVGEDGALTCTQTYAQGDGTDPWAVWRDVPEGNAFVAVSTGSAHACALDASGAVQCWGNSSAASVPANPDVASGAPTALAAGHNQTCTFDASGAVRCFGDTSGTPPSDVSLVTLAVGKRFACGLDSEGAAHCWGENAAGQTTPPANERFVRVVAGEAHACGLTAAGVARCWGDNADGRATPPTGGVYTQVAAGGTLSCGLRVSGAVECWGKDDSGQATPPLGKNFVEVTVGDRHACGRKADGTVLCWGDSTDDKTTGGDGPFTSIKAGAEHTCGLLQDGSIRCWGKGDAGRTTPPEGTGYSSLALGGAHSCVKTNTGDIACFGDGSAGQTTPPPCFINHGGCADRRFATCADTTGSPVCADVDECAAEPSPCAADTRCVNKDSEAPACVARCLDDTCQNGGTCTETADDVSCACAPGFLGERCETAGPTPCDAEPCQNGGTCEDDGDTFTCTCPSGWGGSTCETDVEDNCDPNPCLNGGACVDGVASYTCDCAEGFNGETCQIVGASDDCASDPCQNGGTCTDVGDTFSCACASGWDGATCESDVEDNCPDPDPCQNGGSCTDGVGSYTCSCPAGYSGDTCETLSDTCPTPDPCQNGGVCLEGASGTPWACYCQQGYTGETCERQATACDPSPCQNGGACSLEGDGFACTCTTGYYGGWCHVAGSPSCGGENPCLNGGACVQEQGDYSCSCMSGWGGEHCQNLLPQDPCAFAPCGQNGTCSDDGDGTYTCTCDVGWTGEQCGTPSGGWCEPGNNSCANGTCVDEGSTYSCSCDVGWTGFFCDTPDAGNACDPNPCQNGGTCAEDQVSGYLCTCPTGWTGANCDVPDGGGNCMDYFDQASCAQAGCFWDDFEMMCF